VAVEFNVRFPNGMLVEFTLNLAPVVVDEDEDVDAFSCNVTFCEDQPVLAEIVAICVEETEETVAANVAEV